MPRLSDDDVVDFLVREAIVVKVGQIREEKQKEQQREQWRKGHRKLVTDATLGAKMG